jgi:hypothetical protein
MVMTIMKAIIVMMAFTNDRPGDPGIDFLRRLCRRVA